MKIRPVEAKLFHAKGQISQNWQSLFAILRTPLERLMLNLELIYRMTFPVRVTFLSYA